MPFLSVLLFHVFVSLSSSSPLWRSPTCSRTPYSSHQPCLWPWPDLTRERNKRVRCIRDLHKPLINPFFRKPCATLANFMVCTFQKIFVPINSVIEIHADFVRWTQSNLPRFFYFLSLVATNPMFCRTLECRNTTIWMLNLDQNFKVGIASRETIRFITLQ